MSWLDRLPWAVLIVATIFLGLAPFNPEPHLVEKARLLANGNLRKPIDIVDLVMHAAPGILLLLKAVQTLGRRR